MSHPNSSFFHPRLPSLACSVLAPSLHAQGRAECSVIKSEILGTSSSLLRVSAASFDQDKTRQYPVLYYLHGLGDNEQSLLNFGGWDVISELRRQGKVGDFIVLAPSAGHTFFHQFGGRQSEIRRLLHEGIYAADGEEVSCRGYASDSWHHRSFDGRLWSVTAGLQISDEFAAVSAQMPALMTDLPKDFTSGGPWLSWIADGRCLRFTF